MNDKERLADGHSELVKTMLHAARDDSPSDAALQRTLTALGAGTAILGASASVTGAAAVGGASGGGSSAGTVVGASGVAAAATKAGGLGLLTVKWVGIGVVGGLLTAGVADRITAHDTPTPVAAAAPALPAATSPVAVPLAAHRTGEAAPPAAVADNAKERIDRTTAVKSETFDKPRADSHAPLAAEVAAVDRARDAVAKGDAERALRELDAYERQFGEQRLAPEALYLRMEALMRRGDLKGARASANRLIATDPNGPHTARARAVLSSPVTP